MDKPSASAISRALSAAGMTRSVSHATRIRGWHNYSSGFRASTWNGIYYVDVEWVNGGFRRADQSAEMMKEAAQILLDKGYLVETVVNDAGRTSLKVTKAPRKDKAEAETVDLLAALQASVDRARAMRSELTTAPTTSTPTDQGVPK